MDKIIQVMARNYVHIPSTQGADHIYSEIKLDDKVNEFLKENPDYKLKEVVPLDGDMNKSSGKQFLIILEENVK